MRRILGSVLACGVFFLPVLACQGQPADAPKSKAESGGPITAGQLRTSAKKLEKIALAFHNYQDTHGVLPTNLLSPEKQPLLSWRVQILPFVEQRALYKEFRLDEPWDSEQNRKLIEKMPRLYAPVRGKSEPGLTFFKAFGGSHGWLKPGAALRTAFPDGTSNTLLCAEGANPVVWTKPDDLEFNGKDMPALGGLFDGRFHAAMADGSVNRFPKEIDPDVLKRLIDPADGQPRPDDLGLDHDPGAGGPDDLHEIPPDAKAILEKADSFELLALDLPTPLDDPDETYHGWKVLGKATIDKAEIRKMLIEEFEKGVAGYKGMGKQFFFPRHGLRIQSAGQSTDLVICFLSGNVHAFVDGGDETEFLVSDSAAGTFNKLLEDAGVKFKK